MRMEIVPFEQTHLDDAAELLAARHRHYRTHQPILPASFEEVAVARTAVEHIIGQPDAGGVAALQSGRIVGYLLGSLMLPPPTIAWAQFVQPRAASIPYSGHAAIPADHADIYRAMYATLASRWLAGGYFTHYAMVAAPDQSALGAWASVCFGHDMVMAARDTSPVAGADRCQVDIRRAGPDDLDAIARLVIENLRYHAGAPIFLPYLPEVEADARREQQEWLAGSESAIWLAERDGRAVGVINVKPASPAVSMPERCVYIQHSYVVPSARSLGAGAGLLGRALDWARDAGYTHCALNFMAANLLAERFWPAHGFRPLGYRLFRRVDERIAWAGGQTV
jgi:GNAT superfamily N-acetyltransferase